MKRIIALILAFSMLLTGCSGKASATENVSTSSQTEISQEEITDAKEEPITDTVEKESSTSIEQTVNFNGLDDPKLLTYTEDVIYSDLEATFESEDYIIESVNAVYVSKEYLQELQYNSQSSIFFGYTLNELDEQFEGTRYIFTLGEDGQTTVRPYSEIEDDTYEKVIKNVAIGTGVILICVTVSVATAGTAPAVSMVFAASAKTATTFALSSGGISAVAAGVVKGYQTGDFEEAVKAAAEAGSESFKWGAISGAVIGGAKEAYMLHTAAKASGVVTEAAEFVVDKVDDVNNVTYIKTASPTSAIPTPEEAEQVAAAYYKGSQQVSYLAGEEVSQFTSGATRPDIVRVVGDHIEAIEVKRYDLSNSSCVSRLYSELERQITSRAANLPAGSTQRICLNVQGRGFSQEVINEVVSTLGTMFENVPIDVIM